MAVEAHEPFGSVDSFFVRRDGSTSSIGFSKREDGAMRLTVRPGQNEFIYHNEQLALLWESVRQLT